MFFRALALTISALPLLAAANPLAARQSCSTGPIQCCQSIEKASDPAVAAILGLLGINLQDLDVLVGLTCSPITVIGVGSGGECSATAVCCEDNSHGGLISIGCVPVIL